MGSLGRATCTVHLISARKDLNVPQLKNSEELTVLIYILWLAPIIVGPQLLSLEKQMDKGKAYTLWLPGHLRISKCILHIALNF